MLITYRLFFTFLITSSLLLLSMLLVISWSFDRGFLEYVNTVEISHYETMTQQLAMEHKQQGSWQLISPQQWTSLEKKLNRYSVDKDNTVLLVFDIDKRIIHGQPLLQEKIQLLPIEWQQTIIGYLGRIPRQNLTDPHELQFLQQQSLTYLGIALLMIALAAATALPLARNLVRPIKHITDATRCLASGAYDIRIKSQRWDELGQLSSDFNQLAVVLAAHEQARKQWIEDISHELRTPLAVLRGEIEALQDGVRQADEAALLSLHQETIQLSRLVNDLHELSMSDNGTLSYQKTSLDIQALLEQSIQRFLPKFQQNYIKVRLDKTAQNSVVWGDMQRLQQLFDNLCSNSLRYTDKGGKLQINIQLDGSKEHVLIDFMDSHPSVPTAALSQLFNRLYRVEASRNRATGGTGLGLAICKNIVIAHEGEIKARVSSLGGAMDAGDIAIGNKKLTIKKPQLFHTVCFIVYGF